MQTYRNYIGGTWVDAEGGQTFDSFNPYTAKPWAQIPRSTSGDADRAVVAARQAFDTGAWAKTTASQRGQLLRRIGDTIAKYADHLARIETTDNGKLLAEMQVQLNYMPQWYYYFGGLADKLDGSVPALDKSDLLAFTKFVPIGVVVAFPCWNSPIMNLSWKLAPILAGGNTVVVKPSEFASASILELAKVMEEAGVPPGVFNVVTGYGAEMGEALVSHPGVDKVSFTGGETAAAKIGEAVTKNLAATVYELGGKSAQIVFADADVDNAVKGVVAGIFAACGQTCVAGSRLVLARSIHDQFVEKLVDYSGKAVLGDPLSPGTQLGPMGTAQQREKVLHYIDIGKEQGATIALGGTKPETSAVGDGWFVNPTIFTGVSSGMRIAQEEIFGPVLSVIPFDDEDEAIAIANDVPYGLAGGVWSTNIRRALTAADRIKAGTIWINTYRAVSYMMPFGGLKRSGYGRENGQAGMEEFVQTKSYWLNYSNSEAEAFVMR